MFTCLYQSAVRVNYVLDTTDVMAEVRPRCPLFIHRTFTLCGGRVLSISCVFVCVSSSSLSRNTKVPCCPLRKLQGYKKSLNQCVIAVGFSLSLSHFILQICLRCLLWQASITIHLLVLCAVISRDQNVRETLM